MRLYMALVSRSSGNRRLFVSVFEWRTNKTSPKKSEFKFSKVLMTIGGRAEAIMSFFLWLVSDEKISVS